MERTVSENQRRVRALKVIVAVAIVAIAIASRTGFGQTPAAPQPPATAPLADLKVPAGFRLSVFASDLAGARMMKIGRAHV